MPQPQPDVVFRALGDRTRLAIVARLRAGEAAAGDIAAGFRVSRPAVSRHIRVLRAAKLVSERRDGRNRVYTLNPAPLALDRRVAVDLPAVLANESPVPQAARRAREARSTTDFNGHRLICTAQTSTAFLFELALGRYRGIRDRAVDLLRFYRTTRTVL